METSKLKGVNIALHFARCGRFIFAIKYLEKENPGILRADAIAAVASFGYREQLWYSDHEVPDLRNENRVRVL